MNLILSGLIQLIISLALIIMIEQPRKRRMQWEMKRNKSTVNEVIYINKEIS